MEPSDNVECCTLHDFDGRIATRLLACILSCDFERGVRPIQKRHTPTLLSQPDGMASSASGKVQPCGCIRRRILPKEGLQIVLMRHFDERVRFAILKFASEIALVPALLIAAWHLPSVIKRLVGIAIITGDLSMCCDILGLKWPSLTRRFTLKLSAAR